MAARTQDLSALFDTAERQINLMSPLQVETRTLKMKKHNPRTMPETDYEIMTEDEHKRKAKKEKRNEHSTNTKT